ncbi:MAG TPA: hypothetical protein VK674_06545 [Candidatus Limnocylindria bacterium]|nr:hypothetical protein [Candidatus Limnocylindria bacterium]
MSTTSTVGDVQPERAYDPRVAMEQLAGLDNATRVTSERFVFAWEGAGECMEIVDTVYPEAPVSNEAAGRIATYAREANKASQSEHQAAVAGHQSTVAQFAVDGSALRAEYSAPQEAQTAAAPLQGSSLHPDVLDALTNRSGWMNN